MSHNNDGKVGAVDLDGMTVQQLTALIAAAEESGKSLGLCGGSEIWLMEPAVEDSGADLEQAVCADR